MRKLQSFLPFTKRMKTYERHEFNGDLLAGVIVAIMLIPQAMAYAMLAGLPPQVGLYASILPIIIYSLFGSSNFLAVGPVAITSLMVASAVADASAAGLAGEPVFFAMILAFMSGAMLLALGLARLGFLVNFISHPVIIGFTSAAALLIGLSQLKHLLGFNIPREEAGLYLPFYIWQHWAEINWSSVYIGLGAIVLLIVSAKPLAALLNRFFVNQAVITFVSKAGPLLVIVIGSLLVKLMSLHETEGVKITGHIPAGLPKFELFTLNLELLQQFFIPALIIALVGFMESISVAKALASKRRQKVEPDQELTALGLANISASVTGGYPVTGGFSRSAVNYAAGANSGLASILTALMIAVTMLLLTSWFYYLPKAVLAAIIMVAVTKLFDFAKFKHIWQFNKADAASLIITFFTVLLLGIEAGILTGIAVSIALYLYRTSRPHVAVIGRVGESEHFRNIKHYKVHEYPETMIIRIDESLYFANSRYLEDLMLAAIADRKDLEQIVLVCNAINFIDASALEALENSIAELKDASVTLHLAEVKVPVMQQLEKTDVLEQLKPGRVFLSTHQAITELVDPTYKPPEETHGLTQKAAV